MAKSEPRLTMTLREFADATGLSRNHVYRLASCDALGVPVLKFGKRRLLSRRAVERLLGREPGDA